MLYFLYANHLLLYLSETFSGRRQLVFAFLRLSATSVANRSSEQVPVGAASEMAKSCVATAFLCLRGFVSGPVELIPGIKQNSGFQGFYN